MKILTRVICGLIALGLFIPSPVLLFGALCLFAGGGPGGGSGIVTPHDIASGLCLLAISFFGVVFTWFAFGAPGVRRLSDFVVDRLRVLMNNAPIGFKMVPISGGLFGLLGGAVTVGVELYYLRYPSKFDFGLAFVSIPYFLSRWFMRSTAELTDSAGMWIANTITGFFIGICIGLCLWTAEKRGNRQMTAESQTGTPVQN